MLPVLLTHPKMQFESVLHSISFKKVLEKDIFEQIPFLKEKFNQIAVHSNKKNQENWVMGQLRERALGNIALSLLKKKVSNS